jgi:hypothetical protein
MIGPFTYAVELDTIAATHERLADLGGPAAEVHRERAEHMRAMAAETRDPSSLIGRWLRGDPVCAAACGAPGSTIGTST